MTKLWLPTLAKVAALAFLPSTLWTAQAKSPADGQLTPENFDAEVANGVWFVEHFSPYCSHCKALAPTWEKLVKEAAVEIPTVNLAQVNCAMYGDLCDKNGITGYPSMLLFEDGKVVDRYKGGRQLETFKKYLIAHAPAGPHEDDEDGDEHDSDDSDEDQGHTADKSSSLPSSSSATVNPTGEVQILNAASFSDSAIAQGPAFVKFYAPWCGHCKRLAPIWKQLAKELRGKVAVAEVDCDVETKLCAAQGIKGYPTLVYFQNGARSEYSGGRKLEQLKVFAEKASTSSVELLVKPSDLAAHVAAEPVVYVLIYTGSDRSILKIVREESAVLLGSPRIYATPAAAVRKQFQIPGTVPWALVALKDHDAGTVVSALHGAKTSTRDELREWLLRNRLPGALELTQDSFQGVMNAPHAPLVVIAASNALLEREIAAGMVEAAKAWKARTGGSGMVGGREVVFAWMDGARWKDWLKSMYSIKIDEDEKDLDDVKVVVASHKELAFYDQDRGGKSFKITSQDRLFKSLEDIVSGKLGYRNSENAIERLARTLNKKVVAWEAYIVEYPFRFIFVLISAILLVFYGLYRWIGDDAGSLERGDHINFKTKTGRID